MELQFNKTLCSCLQWPVREVQNQEQTQEIRLSDGMPDIGRVLGAWGQILLRGKEWHTGSAGMSGGVMVWVLYMPEDGAAIQCVESWLPFQSKWDFQDPGRDGTIRISCVLRSVDARSTSARKLMIRTGIEILCEAVVPVEKELYSAEDLPSDVQILRNTYMLNLPREAGEKSFTIDEELTIPTSAPKIEKILRHELRPEMIDQKVLAGKAVFRGVGILHILYAAEDGSLHSWDFEIPFSQYMELDRDYDQNATTNIIPAVTNLELERFEDEKLRLKAGITGQYVIYENSPVMLIADAYSPHRTVLPECVNLQLPSVLDISKETIHIEHDLEAEGASVVDVSFSIDNPRLNRNGDAVQVALTGTLQTLYYDAEGVLQNSVARKESVWSIPAEMSCGIHAIAWPSGKPQVLDSGSRTCLRADALVEATTISNSGLQMVTGLELGEIVDLPLERPSVILRKAGRDSLWDIAKKTGSSVDAIMKANHLQTEADSKQVLLIPVI